MHYARPVLLAWSSQYGHLREVTRDDVLAALGELHGPRRANVLVALRSLFAFCKKRKSVFRSPVQGIRVGERTWGIIQPLSQDEVDQAAEAATTPAPGWSWSSPRCTPPASTRSARFASTTSTSGTGGSPSAAGPARSTTSPARSCPNGSPTGAPAGPPRPTRTSWSTSTSANGTGPISSSYFAKTALRGKAATPERLRVDRQLQEALAAPRPAAPGLHVRPRPQDRDPLRGERPATAHHGRRRARSPLRRARPRTVDTRPGRMPAEGSDGLASVAETLAGLTAAARACGLKDTAALTALAAARPIAPGSRRTQRSVWPMQDEHPSVRYPDPSVRLNSGESRG